MKSLVSKTMKYKMLVADFGETLVHTNSDVEPQNIDAICTYQNAGGIFALTTGREWPSIKRKIFSQSFQNIQDLPVICCYGSIIAYCKTSRVLFSQPINRKLVIDIINVLENNQMIYAVVSMDFTITKLTTDLSTLIWKQYGNQIKVQSLEDIIQFIEVENLEIFKIDVYHVDDVNLLRGVMGEKYFTQLKYYLNDRGFVEFVNSKAGKGQALHYLANYFSLPLSDVVVLGDALNDLEMFEVAENKVAVSNGIESLKNMSSLVIDNHDYLGVSRLINHILEG